ncbi:MAG TPA: alpha/beta fold hydrolase [Ktedonobacterales bacterium]|nr:alpha/beta fold hydrolase [Ktedonobacterales bacterium]
MANHWTEEIVYIATEDNIQLAGAVISPAEGDISQATIVWIHGNAASFYDRPYVLIGRELARLGYIVVLGNTRGHDIATTLWKADDNSPMAGGGGSGWERMEESPLDLAAWVDFAAARSSSSGAVLLAGHSKGAQKALLYAAERPAAQLSGVALISPDLHGLRIPGDMEAARALLADERGMEVIPAQPWAPWYRQSAQTVVSHTGLADRLLNTENGTPIIASIRVPLFAAFGGEERNASAELATIREKATAAPHVTTEIITGADHFYRAHEADVARAIAGWASAF